MTLKKVTRGVNTKFWFAALVCFFGSLFYFYDYFLQSLPGIISLNLITDLKIGAASLGLLSSAYFITYTPMQLIAGLMYDRYGPRFLLTIMVIVCSVGAIIFSFSNNIWPAAFGRLLMGFASAFAFICALGLISRWFDKRLFAPLTGMVMSLSAIGAISAAIPLSLLVEGFGWREATLITGLVGLVLSLLIFLIVRDEPVYSKNNKNNKNNKKFNKHVMTPYKNQSNKSLFIEELHRLLKVLKNKITWSIGLYGFFMWAPMAIFTELWGIPYLSQVAGLSITQSNAHIAIIWVAIGVFCPLVGLFSEILGNRLFLLRLTSIIGIVSIVLILLFPGMPSYLLWLCLFCFGIAPTGSILSFSVVKDINRENLGAAIGFNNMMVVMGGLFFQPLVGVLLENFGVSKTIGNNIIYSHISYQLSLIIIPICFIAGLIISWFFIRETYSGDCL